MHKSILMMLMTTYAWEVDGLTADVENDLTQKSPPLPEGRGGQFHNRQSAIPGGNESLSREERYKNEAYRFYDMR
jgi:hypothetical protein